MPRKQPKKELGLVRWLSDHLPKWTSPYQYFISWLITLLIGFVAYFATSILGIFFGDVFFKYRESIRNDPQAVGAWQVIGLIISALLIGYLLFLFKKKQQFWYGVVETVFACVTCINTSLQVHGLLQHDGLGTPVFVTGFASIYLLVRGLSNIDDGAKKQFAFDEYVFVEPIRN